MRQLSCKPTFIVSKVAKIIIINVQPPSAGRLSDRSTLLPFVGGPLAQQHHPTDPKAREFRFRTNAEIHGSAVAILSVNSLARTSMCYLISSFLGCLSFLDLCDQKPFAGDWKSNNRSPLTSTNWLKTLKQCYQLILWS